MNKYEALEKFWGYTAFRPGQAELIDAILEGRDVLGIMPTGGGKSLCYQVPAVISEGITLVISPLISLMQDQVAALKQWGIKAAYLNSSLSENQYTLILSRIAQGEYKIIYVAPERLTSNGFIRCMQQLTISMITVDEAHCISQWGQDFRPSYLKIAEFTDLLPYRPILSAFTATATAEVRQDIVHQLQLQDPFAVATGFDRKNLYFEVQRPKQKITGLLEILTQNREKNCIVYCATRKSVEEVCETLNRSKFSATRYHAGLSDTERQQNQDDFLYDRKSVMVATNAFGMGIDKSNVSFVIHYNMPKNVESYYQEAGRAGRDGEPAQCILLYSGQDVRTNQFLIENSAEINMELAEETRMEIKEKEHERLKRMTFYCTGTGCLREYLLNYFGDSAPAYCGNCSNCLTNFEQVDVTLEAQKVISCVMRMAKKNQHFGKTMITEVLRGGKDERIRYYGLDELSTYGIMADLTAKRIKSIIDFLLREEYLLSSNDNYPVIRLSDRSREVIKGDTVIQMKLPKEKKTEKIANAGTLTVADEDLFSKLKQLRSQVAAAARVPAYIVFTDAALRDMCAKLPQTKEEFLSVVGVGQAKADKYGKKFTALIREHTR